MSRIAQSRIKFKGLAISHFLSVAQNHDVVFMRRSKSREIFKDRAITHFFFNFDWRPTRLTSFTSAQELSIDTCLLIIRIVGHVWFQLISSTTFILKKSATIISGKNVSCKKLLIQLIIHEVIHSFCDSFFTSIKTVSFSSKISFDGAHAKQSDSEQSHTKKSETSKKSEKQSHTKQSKTSWIFGLDHLAPTELIYPVTL